MLRTRPLYSLAKNNYVFRASSALNHKSKPTLLTQSPLLRNDLITTKYNLSREQQNRHILQQRNYIFFPSSLADLFQTLLKVCPPLNDYFASNYYRRGMKMKIKLRDKKTVLANKMHHRFKNTRDKLLLKRAKIIPSALLRDIQILKEAPTFHEKRLTGKILMKQQMKDMWLRVIKKRDRNKLKMMRYRSKITTTVSALQQKQKNRYLKLKDEMKIRKANLIESTKERLKWENKIVVIDEPTRKDWFDCNGYPLTSKHWLTGRFVNPWNSESSDGQKSLYEIWRWRFQRLWKNINTSEFISSLPTSKGRSSSTMKTNIDTVKSILSTNATDHENDQIRMVWAGHSTCLVSMHGFTFLTDPVFSERIGPLGFANLGIQRSAPPSFSISDLAACSPSIDAVLISHDHYDHLDYASVMELKERNIIKYWVVPLGIKEWLTQTCGVDENNIIELKWWEKAYFKKNTDAPTNESFTFVKKNDDNRDETSVEITCSPTHHWSARNFFDRNTRLWCSFAVKTQRKNSVSQEDSDDKKSDKNQLFSSLNFYFAGDTALPSSFPLHRQIGDRLGPFDLAALPIGAYEPEFFMADSHCNPHEAMKIHDDLGSRKSVGIHWGTFPLADEDVCEPAEVLNDNIKNHQNFCVVRHGDVVGSERKS